MRKGLTIIISLVFVLLLTSVTYAAGWHSIGTIDNPDAGQWLKTSSPHSNLQTSTNQCKTCHAVHEGNGASFKLLQNTSRGTECNACHRGEAAYTDKKPYQLDDTPAEIYGEHTLGLKTGETERIIPNATDDIIDANSIKTDGLSCGNCHSVHDAYTIAGVAAGSMDGKLLRRDPANTGTDAMAGLADSDPFASEKAQAAFCGACHNKNKNFDAGGSGNDGDVVTGSVSEGTRPNPSAHAYGDVDGLVDTYGRLKNVVKSLTDGEFKPGSCSGCHKSKEYEGSLWPHQSRSHKFLTIYTGTVGGVKQYANYQDASTDPNYDEDDPSRTLPKLDSKLCRECHSEIGKPGDINSF